MIEKETYSTVTNTIIDQLFIQSLTWSVYFNTKGKTKQVLEKVLIEINDSRKKIASRFYPLPW